MAMAAAALPSAVAGAGDRLSEGAWLGRMAAAARAVQSNPDIAIRITLEGAAFTRKEGHLRRAAVRGEHGAAGSRCSRHADGCQEPSEKTSRTTAMPPGLAPRTHRPTGKEKRCRRNAERRQRLQLETPQERRERHERRQGLSKPVARPSASSRASLDMSAVDAAADAAECVAAAVEGSRDASMGQDEAAAARNADSPGAEPAPAPTGPDAPPDAHMPERRAEKRELEREDEQGMQLHESFADAVRQEAPPPARQLAPRRLDLSPPRSPPTSEGRERSPKASPSGWWSTPRKG